MDKARKEMVPTVFNHTLGILRNILDFGIQFGARYNNPASGLIRESETAEQLVLPDHDAFQKFVAEIENGDHLYQPWFQRHIKHPGFLLARYLELVPKVADF